MSTTWRMTSSRLPPPLWRFPELEDRSQPAPMAEVEAEAAIDDMGSPAEPLDDRPDGAPTAEVLQDHAARGYSEGWERGFAEGRDQGYAEGIGAAAEAAQAALAEHARHLAAITAQLSAPIPALDAAVEEAVTALALEVARGVIGNESSRSRDYLMRLIREAVAKVPIDVGALKIFLNPADKDLIRSLAPDIEDGRSTLVGDPGIEPGDCLVVADGQGTSIKDLRWRPRAGEGMAQVDLSLAARWRSVMRALFEGEGQ
jgi:flagellar assembly protein FliH